MSRFITSFSVAVLVVSLFVGRALEAQASATPASPAASEVQPADDGSTNLGYWAAWSEAASH